MGSLSRKCPGDDLGASPRDILDVPTSFLCNSTQIEQNVFGTNGTLPRDKRETEWFQSDYAAMPTIWVSRQISFVFLFLPKFSGWYTTPRIAVAISIKAFVGVVRGLWSSRRKGRLLMSHVQLSFNAFLREEGSRCTT